MGNNDLRKRIALGVILIVVGISFLSKDYIALRREKVFSAMNLELTELLAYDDTLEDSLDDESLEDPAVNEEVSDTDVPSVEDPIKNEEVKV